MHVTQLLTASCGIIARQCIIYYSAGFTSGKELALLEMCNQVGSEICDLLGLSRMAVLTTTVLLDPEDGTGRLSRNVGS